MHCLRKFRELLEWCPNVTIRTTYPGLDSLVKKKHLAARMSHLCTEIMSYPVAFKQVESLKVVAALDLGAHLGKEKDILLKPLRSSARMKVFEGTPMSINTDGSEEKGTTAIGFVIYDVTGEELVRKGDVDFGTTANEAELYAIL